MIFAARLFFGLKGLLKRIPWQIWVIAAALAAIALYGRHMEARGYAKAETIWQAKAEELEAARQAALDAEEGALRQLAKETDRNVAKEREASRDRTERFIRSGGVRAQACPGDRGPEDRSAGDGEAVREAPELDGAERLPETVTVLPDDVRICTDNTIKAEAWRDYILGLERRGETAK